MPKQASTGAPSLLPYLKPHSQGLALKFDFPDGPSSTEATTAGDPCGPFTVIRNGKIVLDGHSRIAEVTVLCQADIYRPAVSELNPITNPDVEKVWQQAWGKIRKSDDSLQSDTGALILPSQMGADGALIPLKPLFYCRHVDIYGHPHCPFCGGDLGLCRNDDALQKAGLPAYSGSVQRYLYCPDCHGTSDEAPFYQYPRPKDAPARVQGCSALIEDFSRLLAKADLKSDLPCIGCSEAAACYGAETLVLQRMAAVQFYPFHMLLQKAPTFNAVDFLPLLAGAPFAEVEAALDRGPHISRLQLVRKAGADLSGGSGFLFAGDMRFFLEVLYLKLSFLHEVLAMVADGASGPVNHMSLEGLGVSVASSGGRLPYFWNFALKLIDPVGQPDAHWPGSMASQSLAREFLGLAWFYVLLVNARQPMDAVRAVIGPLRLADHGGQGTSLALSDPVFAPDNIFWKAQGFDSPIPWPTLWHEALGLGVQLLQSDANASTQQLPSLQDIESHLAALKQRVHQSLFQVRPDSRAEHQEIDHSADAKIVGILTSVLDRWMPEAANAAEPAQARPRKSAIPPAVGKPNEDGDFEETVILTTNMVPEAEPEDASAEPDLEKTVLISPQSPFEAGADPDKTVVITAPSADATPYGDDDIEKTVVIKAPGPSTPPADPDKTVVIPAPSRADPMEDLDRTVVIGGARKQGVENDLEETVALRPGGPKPSAPQRPHRAAPGNAAAQRSNEEDDLEATIIMPPRGGKDRKPKP